MGQGLSLTQTSPVTIFQKWNKHLKKIAAMWGLSSRGKIKHTVKIGFLEK